MEALTPERMRVMVAPKKSPTLRERAIRLTVEARKDPEACRGCSWQ
jgi:hypothetical protein